MNTFVVLLAIAAVAFGKPTGEVSHSQDTLGNYNLHYNTEDSSRKESGHQDGTIEGSYTFVDTDGNHHSINYEADGIHGFHATGDLPVQVQETPEVHAARVAHLAFVEKERALLPPLREEEEEHFVRVAPKVVHHVRFVDEAPVHHVQTLQTLPVVSHHVQHVQHVNHEDDVHALEQAKAEHFAAHKKALEHLAHVYNSLA